MEKDLFPGFEKRTITTKEGITINFRIGGKGEPLLLLHGYPQTHVCWHKMAPYLSRSYTLILPDLRGYGDSSKPHGKIDHSTYSKKEMAKDLFELMEFLEYRQYSILAHDRGARVAHRMALDQPEQIKKLVLMDMLPTLLLFRHVNRAIAEGYYHWFFLIQPDNLPENMIGANPSYFIQEKLKRWSGKGLASYDPAALKEYLRCSCKPEAIHAACEDYRAAATIDLVHDQADIHKKITSPLLVLWSKTGLMETEFDVIKEWKEWALNVSGKAVENGKHFIPEEATQEILPIIIPWLQT